MTTTVRVLLVDDEVQYGNVLAKRLRHRGLEATPVFSGKEALRALHGAAFDVAVVDLKMEDLDGLEVLKVARIVAPEMEVIILTGHGGESEAARAVELGAFDYLLKPCELDRLVEKILQAAKGAGKGGSAQGAS